MATRAPSRASNMATPLPIPRLPPVTRATRFLSATASPREASQYIRSGHAAPHALKSGALTGRLLSEPSFHPRHDHRHVVCLLRCSRPFFRREHQGFRDVLRRGVAQTQGHFRETLHPKFFSVHILRLHQPVAVSDQQASRPYVDAPLFVGSIFEYSHHHSAFLEFLHLAVRDIKRRQM